MKDDQKLPSPKDAERDPVMSLSPSSELPPDADIEDRFNDFWKRNGAAVFGALALVAVVVLGFQVYEYLQQRSAERRSQEFGALQSPSEKLEFAQRNADTELGGLAWLQLADEAYAAENYSDAAARYEAALDGLSGNPISARARLGLAMSRLRMNDAAAYGALDQVARDPQVLEPIRGEAAYLLAAAHWSAGEVDQSRRALDLLATLDEAPAWQQRGIRLESRLPQPDEE